MFETAYIDQRKQRNWPATTAAGVIVPAIPPWAQCFYASVVMFLTHVVRNVDPQTLYDEYFDDIETRVGKAGIGEELMRRHNLALVQRRDNQVIRERSGQYWNVQCDGATHYLEKYGALFRARWAEVPWEEAFRRLASGPLVIGTRIPPSDGHIIVLVGITPDGRHCIARDPYGDGRTRYAAVSSGNGVAYERVWLQRHASYGPRRLARIMWLEPLERRP